MVFVWIQQLSAHHAPRSPTLKLILGVSFEKGGEDTVKKNRYFNKQDSTIIGNFETLIVNLSGEIIAPTTVSK